DGVLDLVDPTLGLGGLGVLHHVFAILVGDAQLGLRHLSRPGGCGYPSHHSHASPLGIRTIPFILSYGPPRWASGGSRMYPRDLPRRAGAFDGIKRIHEMARPLRPPATTWQQDREIRS